MSSMQEGYGKYVEEQLRALDHGELEPGSGGSAVATDNRPGYDASKRRQFQSASIGKDGSSVPLSNPLEHFQTRGLVEFPLRIEGGTLRVQPNAVRTSISCKIPGKRWNAKFSGSSLIRGPMGASTGTMMLSYDILPRTLQATSQIAVGDQASVMMGGICHTNTAWYGVGLLYYPKTFAKNPSYAFQLQSEQRMENATMTIKFVVPGKTMKPNTTLSLHNKMWQMEVGMVKSQPHVTLSVSPKLSKFRIMKLSCQWRKAGMKVDAAINQSLGTPKSKVGMGVRYDTRQGLSWLFTWIRGDVIIKIPIFIMSTKNPMQYICSCCLAGVSYLVQECIAELWKLDDVGNGVSIPKKLKTSRSKARDDAENEKKLMERQAKSRRALEEEKSGLVITKAVYYVPLQDSWDVTTQLQFWTDKSSLDLPALSKQNLLGFCKVGGNSSTSDDDEATLWWQFWKPQPKKVISKFGKRLPTTPLLRVQYDYSGSSYEIEINDEESLSLPSNMARKVK